MELGVGNRAAGRASDAIISQKELTECDREPVQLIQQVQSGCGHVVFVKQDGRIVAHDEQFGKVPWVTVSSDGYIGSQLEEWIPDDVLSKIRPVLDGLEIGKSERNFLFHSHDGIAFAISVSMAVAEIYGIEIEEVDVMDVSYAAAAVVSSLTKKPCHRRPSSRRPYSV